MSGRSSYAQNRTETFGDAGFASFAAIFFTARSAFLTALPSALDLPLKPKEAYTCTPGSQVAYDGHVPLNAFEQTLLAVGSAVASLNNPRRDGELHTASVQI